MAAHQKSGATGDSQKGPTTKPAAKTGQARIAGGNAKTVSQGPRQGPRPQKSGAKGG